MGISFGVPQTYAPTIMSSQVATVPARHQYGNIEAKHAACAQTLGQLQKMPGLSSPIVDQVHELNRTMASVYGRVREQWIVKEKPLNLLAAEGQQLQHRLDQARVALQKRKDVAERTKPERDSAAAATPKGSADPASKQRLEQIEAAEQAANRELRNAEANLREAE